MTDLEMTKLSATAIGKEFMTSCSGDRVFVRGSLSCGPLGEVWEPLTNRAQAFELLEKLRMDTYYNPQAPRVQTRIFHEGFLVICSEWHTDLKRAITQCAANYQLEKEKQA